MFKAGRLAVPLSNSHGPQPNRKDMERKAASKKFDKLSDRRVAPNEAGPLCALSNFKLGP